MSGENKLAKFKKINLNGLNIVKPVDGYCMYIKKVCSHYDIANNLEISSKYNYYFIDK